MMAKDFDCPVVCLAQLNRSVESRANKRPMMSDIRESGSVEQDADVIMFLYRESYYNKDSENHSLEIIVSKNRNGSVGTIAVKMDQQTFVFIYASSKDEAIQFYTMSFHSRPLNCHEYPLEFEIARGNDVLSFREMKKEFNSCPAIAGYFLKEDRPVFTF